MAHAESSARESIWHRWNEIYLSWSITTTISHPRRAGQIRRRCLITPLLHSFHFHTAQCRKRSKALEQRKAKLVRRLTLVGERARAREQQPNGQAWRSVEVTRSARIERVYTFFSHRLIRQHKKKSYQFSSVQASDVSSRILIFESCVSILISRSSIFYFKFVSLCERENPPFKRFPSLYRDEKKIIFERNKKRER